ncbi:MAG: hypothetical protein EOL89_10500 [Actinobacteria bacterium]|nr:hypothetical protein [Actinomycetota bacterium]
MDLHEALAIIQSPVLLAGDSNQTVADIAGVHLRRSTALPLPEIDGGVWTRPIDLLRDLSLATWFVHYHPTVFDAFRHWAVLRYIGAFETSGGPSLKLSMAAQRVTGNQRRVLSEDLGIATAVLLARRWLKERHPDVALHVVDIDAAVELGLIEKPPGGRRADYLLTGVDTASHHLFAYGILEAKGTSGGQHHRTQVRKGAAQLEETTVKGGRVPGLVAAVLGSTDLRYKAVEIVPVSSCDKVDLGYVGRLPPTALYPTLPETPAEELLRMEWARIAEIANNLELLARVSTPRLWEGRASGLSARQGESARVHVADATYVGTISRIPLPGGALGAFLGVDEDLVAAIARGDPTEVSEVRTHLRARETTAQEPRSAERAVSVESGTALVLTPVR